MPTGIYPRPPLVERFWSKVERHGPDECWPWQGSRDRKGYGQIHINGRTRPAHCVAYELETGESIPVGIDGCHTCDNPPCCNPRHIFPGTRAENMADARAKGRASAPPHPSGERHPRARLNAAQVREIREEYRAGDPWWGRAALARRFGVSGTAITNIVVGRSWRQAC